LSLARPLAMTCYSRVPVSRAISNESPCARNMWEAPDPAKNPNRRKLGNCFPSEGPHPSSFFRWATHRTLLAAAAARNALKNPIQSSLLQGTHITSAAQSFLFLHPKALVVGAKIFCLRIALILDEPRHLCRRMHRASAMPYFFYRNVAHYALQAACAPAHALHVGKKQTSHPHRNPPRKLQAKSDFTPQVTFSGPQLITPSLPCCRHHVLRCANCRVHHGLICGQTY
jgi:hypothetical protein